MYSQNNAMFHYDVFKKRINKNVQTSQKLRETSVHKQKIPKYSIKYAIIHTLTRVFLTMSSIAS